MQRALLGVWIVCLCAFFAFGCGPSDEGCPAQIVLRADPMVLPPNVHETDITVRVEKQDPNDPREVRTTLRAASGSFGDVHARETTYTCNPAIAGGVEICVRGDVADGGEALSLHEDGSIGSSSEYLGGPHISDRPDCSSTRCIKVECPKGPCPVWREILVRPTTQSLGNPVNVRATIFGSTDEAVKMKVESDCGVVAEPTKAGSTATTTVSCDVLGECSVIIRVIDERNAQCDGTGHHASAVIPAFCQQDEL
jgi:hypothetical protein